MDPMARTDTTTTYAVKVSGVWLDPRTKAAEPHTETYNVAARRPASAEVAGVQLFTAAASRRFCRTGDCYAEAMSP